MTDSKVTLIASHFSRIVVHRKDRQAGHGISTIVIVIALLHAYTGKLLPAMILQDRNRVPSSQGSHARLLLDEHQIPSHVLFELSVSE